jgi:dihydroorotase
MRDILIKNGKLISGEIISIGVDNRKIVEVSNNIEESSYKKIVNLNGEKYISAGWIDGHTHCFNKYKLYSDKPDDIGYKFGVTTVVDAGTAGATTMEEFVEEVKKSKTNVFAFINISKNGISAQDELSDLKKLDKALLMQSVEKYKDFIVGIKSRISKSVVGENNIIPLKMAKEVRDETGLPLMVHIGSGPPTLKDILEELGNGDIIAHCFNGKSNGILDYEGNLKKEFIDAVDRGVLLDIAHGRDSFSYRVCKKALDNGIKADIISSDIYKGNRENGPVYSLVMTMNKLLYVGYTENEVIDMVTNNTAKAFRLTKKGNLEIGLDADITIFDIEDESILLTDSDKVTVKGEKRFNPLAVVLNGEYIFLGEEL